MNYNGQTYEPRWVGPGRWEWLSPTGDFMPGDVGPWMPPWGTYDLLEGGDRTDKDWRSYATREEAINDLMQAIQRMEAAT